MTLPRSSPGIGFFLLALVVVFSLASNAGAATAVPLGDAATFGALSSTAMTNAGGVTVVNGDIGSSTSIDPGVTNGSGSKYLAGLVPVGERPGEPPDCLRRRPGGSARQAVDHR